MAGVLSDLLTYAGMLEIDGKISFINNTALQISGLTLTEIQNTYFYKAPWFTYADETSKTIQDDIEKCAAGSTVSRKIQAMVGSRGLRWISYQSQ